MQINNITNSYNFGAKFKQRNVNNKPDNIAKDDCEGEIKFNDGTMPYNADVCVTKTDNRGVTTNEYFKKGKYIIHETIGPMKSTNYPFEANYQDVDVFDRTIGEHTSMRRYDDGTVDILVKGKWDSKNCYEVKHLDKEGNIKGYTRREYLDYETGDQYWGYDYFCLGNVCYRYIQTRFDKDHKPYNSFQGLEIIPGKKIKSY